MTDPIEYPKWVEIHPSHLIRGPGGVSAPFFEQIHIDRAGNVTVLVADAIEEARALAEKEGSEALELTDDDKTPEPGKNVVKIKKAKD